MESGIFHTTYAKDMQLRPTWPQRVRLILLFVLLFAFPFFADAYLLNLANSIALFAIAAIGLNILVGFTGQISIGHAAFVGVGAFTAGILARNLNMPIFVTIPAACLMAGFVGLIFGLPSARLKGLYLAIATLAAQEIVLWVIQRGDTIMSLLTSSRVEIFGESVTINKTELFGINMSANPPFNFYWLIMFFLIVTALFTTNLFRTRFGRALVAIRDQDIAAQVIGVDIRRYKLYAFALSSFIAGLAGALIAHYRGVVSYERFTIDVSIALLSMLIIGGLGSVSGSIYGAIFVVLLPAILSNIGIALRDVIPGIQSIMPFIQNGAFGVAIILFLILEPQGIAKMWRNVKDYFKLWPFRY